MSHYTVAVIVPKETKKESIRGYISEALAPFNENIIVEPYIGYTKKELQEFYKRYKDSCINENKEYVDYDEYIENYTDCGINEEGNALTTYNPDSKWDWYSIGGRWDNIIKTKSGKKVNFARIKDIIFKEKCSEEQIKVIKEEYEKLITEGNFFTSEYYQEKYPTLESFIEEKTSFLTYAVLDRDGEWHEADRMGWFGISLASQEDEEKFRNSYMDIIDSQDKEDWLVVVDCHI